jgi:hypothetical protein
MLKLQGAVERPRFVLGGPLGGLRFERSEGAGKQLRDSVVVLREQPLQLILDAEGDSNGNCNAGGSFTAHVILHPEVTGCAAISINVSQRPSAWTD